jgi:hypothetical protein
MLKPSAAGAPAADHQQPHPSFLLGPPDYLDRAKLAEPAGAALLGLLDQAGDPPPLRVEHAQIGKSVPRGRVHVAVQRDGHRPLPLEIAEVDVPPEAERLRRRGGGEQQDQGKRYNALRQHDSSGS